MKKKAIGGCLVAAIFGLPGMALGGLIQYALDINNSHAGYIASRFDIVILVLTALAIALVAVFGGEEDE